MSIKAEIKKNRVTRMDKAAVMFKRIFPGRAALNTARNSAIGAGRVFIASGRKFLRDDCLTKASSITYTIILSLVPMLAVALTIYSLYYGVGKDKEELFDQILLLLSGYGIKMNIEPIIDTIFGMVKNAGAIGGISAAVMIFSATALFRSLEKSLNDIWNIKKGRPIHLKIIYYWAALTLGPIILGAGLYVATRISTALSTMTFVRTIINFLAPFAIIWLLFLLVYISLPNTRVPFRPAALGASFTSALWVLFILGFIVYVKSFAGSTFKIYGALAAIPLFLLMLYASSLILLFGAEVAFTLMHPESYRSLKHRGDGTKNLQLYNGIALLRHIYRTFENGGGASTIKDLHKTAPGRPEEIDPYLELFLDEGLIARSNDAGYLPTNSSRNISLNRIIDAATRACMVMPFGTRSSHLRTFLAKLFDRITASRIKTVGTLTLKDVIDKE
ncbi:MAG: YihY/virulence factor BrkB family protein [Spirochaetes bacterium]|nr:YihY/virulence factor BrkB family protein [Spirochaetota bacterium]